MSKVYKLTTEVRNLRGLHARASAKVVKCAENFKASVTISCHSKSAEALSIMDLLMLGAHKGTRITLESQGPEAEEALGALKELIENKFGEEG